MIDLLARMNHIQLLCNLPELHVNITLRVMNAEFTEFYDARLILKFHSLEISQQILTLVTNQTSHANKLHRSDLSPIVEETPINVNFGWILSSLISFPGTGRFIEVARAAVWSLARIACLLPRRAPGKVDAGGPLWDLMHGPALAIAAEMLRSCPLKAGS